MKNIYARRKHAPNERRVLSYTYDNDIGNMNLLISNGFIVEQEDSFIVNESMKEYFLSFYNFIFPNKRKVIDDGLPQSSSKNIM
jgi:hypothetical protein